MKTPFVSASRRMGGKERGVGGFPFGSFGGRD